MCMFVWASGHVCKCVQPPLLISFTQATLQTYTPKSPSLSFKASRSQKKRKKKEKKCPHEGKGGETKGEE